MPRVRVLSALVVLATVPHAARAGDVTVELGGTLRERAEFVSNPLFGIDDRGDDQVLLHRLMVHADVRLTADLRVFVELQDQLATNRGFGRLSTDVDLVDLQQAYLELGQGALMLRIGRQELPLGAGRLSGVRDGANVRRTFDAVRGLIRLPAVDIAMFMARPVRPEPGPFDDAGDPTTRFWGVYGVSTLAPTITLDTYYLGYRRTAAQFIDGQGRELRHSLGVRLAGHRGPFDWDFEGVYQFGRLAQSRIAAWTVATEAGYAWSRPGAPRLGIKANIASGDGRRGDGVMGSFNALFPKLPYFSEADIVVPTNIVDVRPELSVSPGAALRLTGGFDLIWRQRVSDGYYVSPLRPIVDLDARGRFLGRQWIFEATWKPRKEVTVFSSVVAFAPGAALRRVGGRAGEFAVISATYAF